MAQLLAESPVFDFFSMASDGQWREIATFYPTCSQIIGVDLDIKSAQIVAQLVPSIGNIDLSMFKKIKMSKIMGKIFYFVPL